MDIIISNVSDRPIYEQIYRQIKSKIVSGSLPPGEALPSIRSLARELRVSVITTNRAYEELERDGLICTVAGKGSFVAEKNTAILREEHLRQIEEHLREIAQLMPSCGLTAGDVLKMLELIEEEEI